MVETNSTQEHANHVSIFGSTPIANLSVEDTVGLLLIDGDILTLGLLVGDALFVGDTLTLGLIVGDAVGLLVGDAVGLLVGLTVGDAVGLLVGDAVGLLVGLTKEMILNALSFSRFFSIQAFFH